MTLSQILIAIQEGILSHKEGVSFLVYQLGYNANYALWMIEKEVLRV